MEQEITLSDNIFENEFLKNSNLVDDFNRLKEVEQICAEFNFEVLQKQFELSYEEAEFEYITGDFLILSDRLDSMACKLSMFINEKTSGQVLGTIMSKDELEEDMLDIDYLIIVGYLEDESNFKVIDEVRAKNNHRTNVIFYATYSSITRRQMSEYGVNCIFERHKPLGAFLKLF